MTISVTTHFIWYMEIYWVLAISVLTISSIPVEDKDGSLGVLKCMLFAAWFWAVSEGLILISYSILLIIDGNRSWLTMDQ